MESQRTRLMRLYQQQGVVNPVFGRAMEIAKEAIRLDWYDVESQARSVAEEGARRELDLERKVADLEQQLRTSKMIASGAAIERDRALRDIANMRIGQKQRSDDT